MRNVIVGPRGALAMRRYRLRSVADSSRKCVTPAGAGGAAPEALGCVLNS